LSQGYHDLRISVDRKFKISKGVEVNSLEFKFRKLRENLWRLRASEVLRKSSEAPIFTDLMLNRRGVKGNKASSKNIPLPGVNKPFPFTAVNPLRSSFTAPLSLSLS
jgi:hypothetical protein